jgi:hypothetical protein
MSFSSLLLLADIAKGEKEGFYHKEMVCRDESGKRIV